MATQVRDLRDRAEVWLAAPVEQPNGETDYCYTKVKTIWAANQHTGNQCADNLRHMHALRSKAEYLCEQHDDRNRQQKVI